MVSDNSLRITAKISRNFRDVQSGAPKVLLRGLQTPTEDFRDHAWVEHCPSLKRITDTLKDNSSLLISFTAEAKDYNYRGESKRTLTNIKNIRVLGRA